MLFNYFQPVPLRRFKILVVTMLMAEPPRRRQNRCDARFEKDTPTSFPRPVKARFRASPRIERGRDARLPMPNGDGYDARVEFAIELLSPHYAFTKIIALPADRGIAKPRRHRPCWRARRWAAFGMAAAYIPRRPLLARHRCWKAAARAMTWSFKLHTTRPSYQARGRRRPRQHMPPLVCHDTWRLFQHAPLRHFRFHTGRHRRLVRPPPGFRVTFGAAERDFGRSMMAMAGRLLGSALSIFYSLRPILLCRRSFDFG